MKMTKIQGRDSLVRKVGDGETGGEGWGRDGSKRGERGERLEREERDWIEREERGRNRGESGNKKCLGNFRKRWDKGKMGQKFSVF